MRLCYEVIVNNHNTYSSFSILRACLMMDTVIKTLANLILMSIQWDKYHFIDWDTEMWRL